jgi:hypothetical protein
MRTMKKTVIAAIAVVVVAGGSAMAYSAYARHDGWGHGRAHFGRMSPDDRAAYADARIAALKAGLRLSAEQEKFWPPVEATLKDLAAKRITRQEERRTERTERRERREEWRRDGTSREERRAEREERTNPIERLRKGADRMSEGGADLKRLADATEPLYNSLDDSQKRRFNALAHAGMRRFAQRTWRRGEDRESRRDRREHNRDWHERIEWTPEIQPGLERL